MSCSSEFTGTERMVGELPNSWEVLTHKLGLFTEPAVAEAGSLAKLQLRLYWYGLGWEVEIQNKAEAWPSATEA